MLSRVRHVETKDKIAAAANYLFRIQGDISIANLALPEEMGLRQFERWLQSETGLSSEGVFALFVFMEKYIYNDWLSSFTPGAKHARISDSRMTVIASEVRGLE